MGSPRVRVVTKPSGIGAIRISFDGKSKKLSKPRPEPKFYKHDVNVVHLWKGKPKDCGLCDTTKSTKNRIPACKRPAWCWVWMEMFRMWNRLYLCRYHRRLDKKLKGSK